MANETQHGDCATVKHVCTKEDNIDRMERKVDKIYQVLIEGNGRPPVIGQLALHEITMKGIIALDVIIISGLIGLWWKG
jgi:hypothetical protein